MTIYTNTKQLICFGFILLLFVVQEGECRGGGGRGGGGGGGGRGGGGRGGSISMDSSSSSGTEEGPIGAVIIVLGCTFGGLLLIVFAVILLSQVFESCYKCCKSNENSTSGTTAYTYSPYDDDRKIHDVKVTIGSRMRGIMRGIHSLNCINIYRPPPQPWSSNMNTPDILY